MENSELKWDPSPAPAAPEPTAADVPEATSAASVAEESPQPPRPVRPPQSKSSGDLPQWLIDSEPPKGSDQWVAWKTYVMTKSYRRPGVPVPNLWGSYRARIAENHAFVRKESDDSMAIVAVVSVKGGGGKTTTTTWDGAEDSELTNGLTLILDADSSGVESASERLSIENSEYDREFYLSTPQVADKILHRGWIPTAEQLTFFTTKHAASRVRVLAMDTSDLSRAEMKQVLRALKPSVHSIYVDTTPGLKEPNTYGVIDAATLVVVSTIYDNTSALNAAKQTLDTKEYGLRQRLANGDDVILAVHGVESRDFNPRYQYQVSEEFGLQPNQISLFPMDKYAFKARPVDRGKVSERYLFALSEHRRRCAEAAIRWNQKYPLNPLPGDDEEADAKVAAQAAAEQKARRKTIKREAKKLARQMVREMSPQNSVRQPVAETPKTTPVALDTDRDTIVTLEGSAK